MCPRCECCRSYVLRTETIGDQIRRRRECEHCGKRYTTWEAARPPTPSAISSAPLRCALGREDAQQEAALAQLEGRDPRKAAHAYQRRERRRGKREQPTDPALIQNAVDERYRTRDQIPV